MIYVRNLFTQDLRDGKQIAFPTEPSNLLFKFSFSNQDPSRKISFKFIVKDNTSPNFLHNDKIINTRLYSAGSESRIDGELKQFLRDTLNAEVDDIIVIRAMNLVSYEFEFIPKGTILYPGYKAILNGKNHEIVLEQDNNEHIENKTTSQSTNIDLGKLKEDFATWFIKLDGIKHNYYSDSFGSSRDKLLEQLTKYDNLYKEQFGTYIFNLEGKDSNIFIDELERNLYLEDGAFFQFSLKTSTHMPRAILGGKNYIKFLKELFAQKDITQIPFNIESFQAKTEAAGLIFSPQLIQRFIASLYTKPFVICSGLSGSGKTKLAQAFVQWICENEKQYKIIPVGADWTNREPLLGYPNGLDPKSYVTPDSGALQLILEATKEENQSKPYFMILDEMNLSHVERYFADFLSIMESGDSIKLYSGVDRVDSEGNKIDQKITWPKNLFIIGTVNIDETTYMFSPKVLDRANVIEFRISQTEMKNYFDNRKLLAMEELFFNKDKNSGGAGQNMGTDFYSVSQEKTESKITEAKGDDNVLNDFFTELQIVGSEFGYRSANEIDRLMFMLEKLGQKDEILLDIAIMQKLLPKLHGSRSKLNKPLTTLAKFCVTNAVEDYKEKDEDFRKKYFIPFDKLSGELLQSIKYKISFEKISRMHKNAMENGFTSYAEA